MAYIDPRELLVKRERLRSQLQDLAFYGRRQEALTILREISRIDAMVI